MIGRMVGFGFSTARDAIARLLVRLRVTPNMLTLMGMVFMTGAGVCYALGSDHGFAWSFAPGAEANIYLLGAAILLILASACDMLDGAVARLGGKGSDFGAFLDSTLDRFSDFAVFAGIAICYVWRGGNITFVLLSMLAFFNAFMISYTKARAEDFIGECKAGYWQRGERSAAILIATFSYNMPALVVQQAILPMFTVWRRIAFTKRVIEGKPVIIDPRQGGWWLKIQLWRWPRMTIPYDVITGANIAWLIFVRFEPLDVFSHYICT